MNQQIIYNNVKEYYGNSLKGTKDLKTNSCTCSEKPPSYIIKVIKDIHDEIVSHYYGCGLCIPEELEGISCLDLGCGAGRDVYILSKLVGEKGHVTGVDMTKEQLVIAEKYKDYQAQKFGYEKSNVNFIQGFIEDLSSIPDNSIDLIISNCVINLCLNKEKVFSEAYRVLKQGGEMYFSDVYSDRRIPEELLKDPVLHGECLSGALYWNDFLNLVKKIGFKDPRLFSDKRITIDNKEIENKIGFANFFSATYRLIKLDNLEEGSENYGLKIKYKGTISTSPDSFHLDNGHIFLKDQEYNVCGNTYKLLHDTRFSKHFEFYGNFDTHYGFMCEQKIPFKSYKVKCCQKSDDCCGQKERKGCCGQKEDNITCEGKSNCCKQMESNNCSCKK